MPIWRMLAGPRLKALIFGVYYLACAVAVFIASWAAIGVFGAARLP